ncbi:MAG: response regulator transcription factor [Nitrospira sp.]|nr:response regulator transcription factor [Nitrospira sp.]
MTDTSGASPTLTIAILSSQCLVWLGLQKILESSATVPMIVRPNPGRTSDLLRAERRPDLFILDLETERDALGTITQIREAAPTSKIVLLCGIEDKDRTREVFACGVDGIILKVQPPAVVLAVIEALYASAKPQASVEWEGAGRLSLAPAFKKTVEPQPPAWPDALTEREREIIRLVGQGLSNKDIAYKLSISDSTVRCHMTSIFDKVGVPNRQKLLFHVHQFRSSPV